MPYPKKGSRRVNAFAGSSFVFVSGVLAAVPAYHFLTSTSRQLAQTDPAALVFDLSTQLGMCAVSVVEQVQ
jgi:hypothetical protein